jgi:hypothetical protein
MPNGVGGPQHDRIQLTGLVQLFATLGAAIELVVYDRTALPNMDLSL